jgi:hypothetical protein
MEIEHQEPLEPGRTGTVRSTREPIDPRATLVIRVGFFLMMSGLAILLAYNGRKAIRDRHFDNRWTTTTGTGVNSQYMYEIEHGEELLEGEQAVRFGVGMLAAAAMLAEWSFGLALVIVRRGKASDKPKWTVAHSVATVVSLVCVLTALAGLLPPEHFHGQPFTIAFYGTIVVLSVAVVAATACKRPRVAALIFPALAIAAVSIAPLAGGIIFGFFAWLVLATHVLLLVPSLREQALNAEREA